METHTWLHDIHNKRKSLCLRDVPFWKLATLPSHLIFHSEGTLGPKATAKLWSEIKLSHKYELYHQTLVLCTVPLQSPLEKCPQRSASSKTMSLSEIKVHISNNKNKTLSFADESSNFLNQNTCSDFRKRPLLHAMTPTYTTLSNHSLLSFKRAHRFLFWCCWLFSALLCSWGQSEKKMLCQSWAKRCKSESGGLEV